MSVNIIGNKPLKGTIQLGGSKHSALHLLGAIPLVNKITIENIPDISDVRSFIEIYGLLGYEINKIGSTLIFKNSYQSSKQVIIKKSSNFRSSLLLLGGALLKNKQIMMHMPGGDIVRKKNGNIVSRKITKYLKLLDSFGIENGIKNNDIVWARLQPKGLFGNRIIDLNEYGSIGNNNTALCMILAAGNKGATKIDNALVVREITELGYFLENLGVEINGLGTNCIEIISTGISRLKVKNEKFTNSYDKTEALFWIIADIISSKESKVIIKAPKINKKDDIFERASINKSQLEGLGIFLRKYDEDSIVVDRYIPTKLQKVLVEYENETNWIPDAAPQIIALLSQSIGTSTYNDNKFGLGRLQFYMELNKLGAKIKSSGKNELQIQGIKNFKSGCEVNGTEIRGAATLILVALSINGRTIVNGEEYLKRGYENLFLKLKSIGASIEIIDN